MKLLRVALKNYKHLKQIDLAVSEGVSSQAVPAFFCIGLNGSGKSVFLEALALIFSRISQDELPGFWFEVEYEVFVDGRSVRVTVKPERERRLGRLAVTIDGERYHSFEGREDYLPHKVVVCVSGFNSQMKQFLGEAARNSIVSDIYDAEREDPDKIQSYLQYMNLLNRNPRMLYLDEEMAPYALFALCAWNSEQEDGYDGLRKELFHRAGENLVPTALSLVAGEKIGGALLKQLFEELSDWVTEGEEYRTAVFELKQDGGLCHPKIRRAYENPMQLLTLLSQARESGELRECHFFFKRGEGSELLNEKALSDGELLWLARMGMVLTASQGETDNCLFLFDEPDIHLNESWNVEFVRRLEQMTWREEHRNHCFWIATHSSLLLTDALPDQVFLFEREAEDVRARRIPISLFAGNRQEISRNVFRNGAQIGEFADRRVREMMREQNPEQLEKYIEQVGSGIWRFKLLEKYYMSTEE
ncbi:MAG: hypothetical protein K2L18_09750 [Acetatifactor sp.]|nr:hypothetical protein [Acetatifactor sp.]